VPFPSSSIAFFDSAIRAAWLEPSVPLEDDVVLGVVAAAVLDVLGVLAELDDLLDPQPVAATAVIKATTTAANVRRNDLCCSINDSPFPPTSCGGTLID
jgi:hypothetical protein